MISKIILYSYSVVFILRDYMYFKSDWAALRNKIDLNYVLNIFYSIGTYICHKNPISLIRRLAS